MSNILDSIAVENTANGEVTEYEFHDKGARAQIAANVTANTDSNANYAAEVVDARVDSENKTHQSLGDALRNTDRRTRELCSAFEKEVDSNKKAIDELSSKKITKFYTNSLGAMSLLDSDKGKTSDMKIYGKSEQKQYTGKNLLNPTLGTVTRKGVTCTNNGDGTYTLTGSYTETGGTGWVWFIVRELDLTENQKVRLVGCPKDGGSGKYTLMIRHTVDTEGSKYDYGNGVIFTAAETESHQVYIGVRLSKITTPLVFKPMLVDADLYPDVTYDDFEPYVGGIPSPNPDYPQEIKSVGDDGSLVVKSCGKNLIKNILTTKTINGVTFTTNSDGSVTVDGTSTDKIQAVATVCVLELKKGDKYILSGGVKGGSHLKGLFIYYKPDYTKLNVFVTEKEAKITIPITGKYIVYINVGKEIVFSN